MNKFYWKYVGFDESNHGFDRINFANLPEICVAVASLAKEDLKNPKNKLGKPRTSIKKAIEELDKKGTTDYSFLLFNEEANKIIPEEKKLGIVLGSLVKGEIVSSFIDLYIDGVWHDYDKEFAQEIISEITRIRKNEICIYDGKDLDKMNKLVNYADRRAYWLLKKEP